MRAMAQQCGHRPTDLEDFKRTSSAAASFATNLNLPARQLQRPNSPGPNDAANQHNDVAVDNIKNNPPDLIVTDVSFRPQATITATAAVLGCPTENENTNESIVSSSSSHDMEKGMASVLVEKHMEALHHEESTTEDNNRDSGHHAANAVSPKEISKLPLKRDRVVWRNLRLSFFTAYQRLFTMCVAINTVTLVVLLGRDRHTKLWGPDRGSVATAAATNVLAAFLIRQENVVNLLYAFCCATPLWAPLRFRRAIAKLYHLGGVHSGCAVSATAWFILFAALITRDYASGNYSQPAVVVLTYVLLALILAICVSAIPRFRTVSHNTFEAVHRFAGWITVGILWVLVLLLSKAASTSPGADTLGIILVKSPVFWVLLAITFFTILPWLRLRKLEAFPEVLSSHAVRIHFRYPKYRKVGSVLGLRISDNPLKEWHPFASIPAPDGQSFSLIVSNAGDWTQKQIQSPAHAYWVRGIPIIGMLRMAVVFRRIVVVATGSGIGPVLSLLISHPVACRLLWSTPSPETTYGEAIMESVCKADPDAIIIDTRVSGRPDMVALAYHLYVQSNAEAVFCISNASSTRKVVYGLESRGVPAYGPIWDS